MNKQEFEKVIAAAAEKSGVAGMARDYQLAENLQSMMIDLRDKLYPTEQPSEGLEKAADYYLDNAPTADFMEGSYDGPQVLDAFRAGANWQKEQMMEQAIDAVIVNDETSGCVVDCEQGCLVLEPHTYPLGQKLKLLIIKEEEQ